jgi:hypothetical protein
MTDHIAACAAEIVALINSKSTSPTQQEIEAVLGRIRDGAPAPVSDLRVRLRSAMAKADAAVKVAGRLMPGAEFDLAEAEVARCAEGIRAIEDEIPSPPRSFEDLVARAEIARHGGEVLDGKLKEAEDREDTFQGPAARLIVAVLQFGGDHREPAPGERPRMPQLTDKDLNDLYAHADEVEIGVRGLREKLECFGRTG